MGRTIIIALFTFALPFVVQAVEINQDFDSYSSGTAVNTLPGINASSSSSYVISDMRYISSPNGVVSLSTGSSNYIDIPLGDTIEGVLNMLAFSRSTFGDIFVEFKGNQSGEYARLRYDDSTVSIIDSSGAFNVDLYATPIPSQVWYDTFLEYRKGDSFYEVRASFFEVTTDWLTTSIPISDNDAEFNIRIVRSSSNIDNAAFDNLTVYSDGDYVSDSELEVITNVTQEYNTHITDLTATQPATSSVTLHADWFIDQTELIESLPPRWPTMIQFGVTNESGTTTYETYYSTQINNQTATGTATSATFGNLPDGVYYAIARFYNESSVFDSSNYPFPLSNATINFTITGGILSGVTTALVATSETYNNIQQYKPCSITQIQGCIQNSLTYLFVPTSASLENFRQLSEEVIPNKYPFAWFYATGEIVQAIDQEELEFPEYTLNIPLLGGEFTILSADTIDLFLLEAQRELFKDIVFWFFLLMFLVMVFFTIGNIFGFVALPTETESVSDGYYGNSQKSRASHH